MPIVDLLLWIGMAAGGLMILLMLASILGGLDLGGGDVDIDIEGDADPGLGIVKSALTFVSVASFTARAFMLNSSISNVLIIGASIIAGSLAVMILTVVLKLLLSNQETGNWNMSDAVGLPANVYIPIAKNGFGRVIVKINDADREINARSESGKALSTNTRVLVIDANEDHLTVVPVKD